MTGKFYGDVLQERIFRPLGMQTTRIMSEADIIPNRAAGYRLVKGQVKNQEWVSPTSEYHRRRQPLFFDSGFGEVGCGALHRETVEALQPGTDVDGGEAQRWSTQFRVTTDLAGRSRIPMAIE